MAQFIRKCFKDMDDDLAPDKREELSNRLVRIRDQGIPSSWVADFTEVFDRFFSKRHLSWRCFLLSLLISFISFWVFLIIFSVFIDDMDSFEDLSKNIAKIDHRTLATIALGSLLINGLADYVSLLETRLFLKSKLSIGVVLILDVIATLFIVTFWLGFALYVSSPLDVSDIAIGMLSVRSAQDDYVVMYVFILTTFTTSIWLWLHGISHATIKILKPTSAILAWTNVQEKPMLAIGRVAHVYIMAFSVLLFGGIVWFKL